MKAASVDANFTGKAHLLGGAFSVETAMDQIASLEALLAKGRDSALLRFSLGNAYFKAGDFTHAIEHLATAVSQDPGYSAAWKIYGRALSQSGRYDEAVDVLDRGIEVAESKGDIQAAKEMRVFRGRAEKSRNGQ